MSGVLRNALRRILFRYGWDTRCRHRDPARLLRRALADRPTGGGPALLDVGCGRAGMAAFLSGVEVMGVDLEPPSESLPNRVFTLASITALPFADGAFPYVSCVDVLQDLAPPAREQAIAEMVRVAREGVVITSPQAEIAERADAEFQRAAHSRGVPAPSWVGTSLMNPYPTVDGIAAAIRHADPRADVSVSYAELIGGSRLVRAAAVRSRALYAVVNIVLGLLMPVMPRPDAAQAYRALIVARPGGGAS
jgi:SAM-dependent methyltransferase